MTTFPRIAAHVSTANLMTQKNCVGPDDDDEEDDVPENIAGPNDDGEGDGKGDDQERCLVDRAGGVIHGQTD